MLTMLTKVILICLAIPGTVGYVHNAFKSSSRKSLDPLLLRTARGEVTIAFTIIN
jgi:hypothetical protein